MDNPYHLRVEFSEKCVFFRRLHTPHNPEKIPHTYPYFIETRKKLKVTNRSIQTAMLKRMIQSVPCPIMGTLCFLALPVSSIHITKCPPPPPALLTLSILGVLLHKIILAVLTAARFPAPTRFVWHKASRSGFQRCPTSYRNRSITPETTIGVYIETVNNKTKVRCILSLDDLNAS